MTSSRQRHARVDFLLAVATGAITWVLVILGGVVWSTGSALACPDWPLCHGQVFPRMEGQVLLEHGHRLVAALVAASAVVLALRTFADRRLRGFSLLAVGLVLAQALLGGLTVLLRLPLSVRVLHLATSQAFFASIVFLGVRAWQVDQAERTGQPVHPVAPVSSSSARALALAAGAVYGQLLLGSLVRHEGAGMACRSPLLCAGQLWPSFGPGQLQMLHRFGALLVAAVVIWATLKALPELKRASEGQNKLPRRLAVFAHVLLLVQICLGVGSVQSFLSVPVVTAHLATGALLWVDLVMLWAFTRSPGLDQQQESIEHRPVLASS